MLCAGAQEGFSVERVESVFEVDLQDDLVREGTVTFNVLCYYLYACFSPKRTRNTDLKRAEALSGGVLCSCTDALAG